MKKLLTLSLFLCVSIQMIAQSDPAILDLASTEKGFLMPRMTTAQMEAITNPADGLQIYNVDTGSFWYFDASWHEILNTKQSFFIESKNDNFQFVPNPGSITKTVTFSDVGRVFNEDIEIEICVHVIHGNNTSDQEIQLKSPSGTIVTLSSENGGEIFGGHNIACFTTSATVDINTGSPPFNGVWIPEDSFTNFYGDSIDGTWELIIKDLNKECVVANLCFDDGSFNSFTLKFYEKSMIQELRVEGVIQAAEFKGGNFQGDGSGLTNLDIDLAEVLTNGSSASNTNITDIADPINDLDAVNKQYVDPEPHNGLAYNTGWSDYDVNHFKGGVYYKHQGRVYLDGLIKKETDFIVNEIICTLPVGYRPMPNSTVILHAKQQGVDFRVDVRPNGDVVLRTAEDDVFHWLSLTGLNFTIR